MYQRCIYFSQDSSFVAGLRFIPVISYNSWLQFWTEDQFYHECYCVSCSGMKYLLNLQKLMHILLTSAPVEKWTNRAIQECRILQYCWALGGRRLYLGRWIEWSSSKTIFDSIWMWYSENILVTNKWNRRSFSFGLQT